MKFPHRFTWLSAAWLTLLPATAVADEEDPALSAGFLAFGDLYYLPSHHTEAGDGAAGAVVRRAYFTLNAKLPADWFGRLRFEMNQSGEFEEYEFEADFKDLYIGREFGRHRFVAGLQPSLTFDLIEKEWGLRYLERTPMDLQGISSRETGLSLNGPLDAEATWSYRVMVDPTIDFGKDTNATEKWMGAVTWKPEARWTVDLYADYEERDGPSDRTTLQAFAGYKTDGLRVGLQYSHQDREEAPPLELASGYAVAKTGAKTSAIFRVDRLFEPSPRGDGIDYHPFDPSAPATLLIAGLEYAASEHVFITPNVFVIRYDHDDEGQRPDTDVHLQLTLFFNFE